MNSNYLKGYPYLFVRESDQTDYFCTLCDAFLKEEELQAHLFDGHQAEDCSNYFVRVTTGSPAAGSTGPENKRVVHICVVCWGKLPNPSEMASHRQSCKMQTNGNKNEEKSVDLDADQEVTKLVTTPDIQCYEDMDGPDTSNGTSKASSPPPAQQAPQPVANFVTSIMKRGRKKQLHPQQVLTPERIKEVVTNNLTQCGLCEIVMPASEEIKHLQEWHRLTVPLDNTLCPLCSHSVHILELVPHLTLVHSVTPPSTGHALLLWLLTSTQLKKSLLPMHQMMLQTMLNKQQPTTMTPPPTATPPLNAPQAPPPPIVAAPIAPPPAVSLAMPPTSSSFLQSLLNGESNTAPGSRDSPANAGQTPRSTISNSNFDMSKLEHVVTKLTRKHTGINARESYQCQICSKWFAVPPIKHLRGHLVTFKEEQRLYVALINNNGFACLNCYHISAAPQEIAEHIATMHHPGLHTNDLSSPDTPKHENGGVSPTPVQPLSATGRPSGVPTIIADPKGVELDNAGRVKSGKVRKQCELCGQWSNIKWFFKHMSEVHNALFCRCCREYLPIHEQEEHRRFHAEPPYMGQKIRIENGQPIIIDRKERASLTPIGSLAAWGGSSGGMVVKAIDDGTSHIISRKRKGTSANGTPSSASKIANTNNSKDTLMPKETCPVCGIQITYKNLARHIKLRHKIKYKFCHKCRKFVPNDTYEDHRLTCTADYEMTPASMTGNNDQVNPNDTHDSVDASDYLDMDGASALVINTDDNEDTGENGDSIDDESKNRSNTSKNKLESLLGKEFKHPRRKCGICGYMVSYSNYKRHLKNAHPSVNQDDHEILEEPDANSIKYLGHQMDEDDLDDDIRNKENFVECHICGDHIIREFLDRHLKMNHDNIDAAKVDQQQIKMRECPVCEVKMRVEGIVKHCKSKHKVTYKWCRPCEKYVLKKQYRTHIQSSGHRELVNDAEKHSSHEEDEDDDTEEADQVSEVSAEPLTVN